MFMIRVRLNKIQLKIILGVLTVRIHSDTNLIPSLDPIRQRIIDVLRSNSEREVTFSVEELRLIISFLDNPPDMTKIIGVQAYNDIDSLRKKLQNLI